MIEKIFTIKKDQLFFLIKHLSNSSILDKFRKILDSGVLLVNCRKTNRYQINLTEDEVSILLDELTLLFTSEGLKKNDEPNDLGLLCEELIDVFSN